MLEFIVPAQRFRTILARFVARTIYDTDERIPFGY
jgi:hypothetical protein